MVNTYIPGTTILSSAVNANFSDIATGLSDCVTRDGQGPLTAAMQMGSNKITGMADPTVSTDAATKNYVDTQVATNFSTGDIKLTLKNTADSGWLLFDDTTMGSAGSGATHASSANQNLFNLLYNNINDANCPVLTSSGSATTRAGQGTAAQAWAANCRMTLPLTLGRALAISGSGSGLTTRALGATTGTETVTLSASQIPSITSTVSVSPGGGNVVAINNGTTGNVTVNAGASTIAPASNANWTFVSSISGTATSNNTGSSSVSNMQPSSFLNAMVKL